MREVDHVAPVSPAPGSPLSRSAVGARVVVRHRDGRGEVGDVLGVLERFDDAGLAVRRADGRLVDVAARAVLAARVVPPAGTTVRGIRALEEAAALGWPGVEQQRLGGWLLRAGHGFTGRANSVLPLHEPDRPLEAAVDAVEVWFRSRGLAPRAALPDRLGGGLDAVLSARGWPADDPAVVLVRDLDAGQPDASSVAVTPTPDDAWLATYRYRGRALPPGGLAVLLAGAELGFGCVPSGDGSALAVGRAGVSTAPDGGRWVGVSAVEVERSARRQGLGRHVVQGLLGWGRGRGATRAYTQVLADDTGAREFWDRLGFTEHHRYRYRRHPG